MMKPPIFVITGPTACGKTKTAIMLAKAIDGEVISADSMQIYKYMDIGTAKPTILEMDGVRHHCIDERLPDEAFSAALFHSRATACANDIYARHKIPIVAGGTGFYINAFLYNTFLYRNDVSEVYEREENEYRAYLYDVAAKEGNAYLHALLDQHDPESAREIHPNNVKRVVRALAYYWQTGEKISVHNSRERERDMAYDAVVVILTMDRARLYDRIDRRVDAMIDAGLVAEVQMLLERGYQEDLVSMQGLGYKETVQYLRGRCTLAEAVERIKRDSRRYAKRQLTWFRHQCDGLWLNVDEFSNWDIMIKVILDYAANHQKPTTIGRIEGEIL